MQNKWREKQQDEKTTGSVEVVAVHYESVYYIISTWVYRDFREKRVDFPFPAEQITGSP